MFRFSQLQEICEGSLLQWAKDWPIATLLIDSRKSVVSEGSLFFAIKGTRHNGHDHIQELYRAGLRQFVVEEKVNVSLYPDANFLLVDSSISALQKVATHHRKQFSIPVIGITGSNGKTIIKEWLYQLLSPDQSIVKNPGSYNSQLGVPLSIWQIQPQHQLGLFEAGISQPNEMDKLKKIIEPTIGIFTNIGSAHAEGFESRLQKIEEKSTLFKDVKKLICCADHSELFELLSKKKLPLLAWGKNQDATIRVEHTTDALRIYYQQRSFDLQLPFHDPASVENCLHCVALMLYLGYPFNVIQERVLQLRSVAMRLEMKQGMNGCLVIDDTYNNDLAGLRIGLDFLGGQQKKKKALILSDFLQSGLPDRELLQKVCELLAQSNITKLIAIGPRVAGLKELIPNNIHASYFPTTEAYLQSNEWEKFENEAVLVKGARAFRFEQIVRVLQRKLHGTVMEIDLNKVVHNLNFFKARLKLGVKLMVMVKAFAYGSGSEEVANLLAYHQVNYLGVAYADEGIDLRKNSILLSIMVMNPAEENFQALIQHRLEPVIYNLKLLKSFIDFIQNLPATIHIEVDTGMHRLGFDEADLPTVIESLKGKKNIKIASVFSHLAGADEAAHDDFSKQQYIKYLQFYQQLTNGLGVQPIRHILNSPGILRLPDFQMDMVRLGIGLYGVNPTAEKITGLESVATLKTVVSQIRQIKKGESIGYGRKGLAEKDLAIATIAIGYADGFSRGFSNGQGVVLIKGERAPVIGNVCMDMTMVDVTGIDVFEGDEVIIFGNGLPIQEVADRLGTIPYEILTNTSERVKRVFVTEGI